MEEEGDGRTPTDGPSLVLLLIQKPPEWEGASPMADPAPVGSDVSAGTYRCTNCGYELAVQSVQSLPPCPECEGPYSWEALTGGDSSKDPPERV